ncbi:hypothetical protein STANM309S_05148 [Streptomyces tanashiensis]
MSSKETDHSGAPVPRSNEENVMSAEAAVGSQAENGPPADRARTWTLALASVAMFMLMLDVTVVNVALQT